MPFSELEKFLVKEDLLHEAFFGALKNVEKDPFSILFDLESEAIFSFLCDLSKIQDSFRFRVTHRAKKLGGFLVDEGGKLNSEALNTLISLYEAKGEIFSPSGEKDHLIYEHHLNIFKKLQDFSFFKLIERFSFPLCHKGAEFFIREALGLNLEIKLENKHLREAILASCFSFVRQNVGSCFATAPAILIHENRIEQFLDDLYELLSRGRLTRIFSGVEYSVPLALSTGAGDLKKGVEFAAFCPGLIEAFSQAKVIDPSLSLSQKIEKSKKILSSYKGGITIEEFLHDTLLKEAGLTKAQYASFLKGLKSSSSLFTTPLSLKNQAKAEEVQTLEKLSRSAFKGLVDNALLKVWEYTLASFSEVKMEFSNWNLYSSLGLNPEENGGLGEVVYKYLQEKVEECNQKISMYQKEYEGAYNQVKVLEVQARNAGKEREVYFKAQFAASYHHMQICLDLRDKFHTKGSYYANFLNLFIEKLSVEFKQYFQELYDPEMQEFKAGIYDDEPAGFRLVYKHGRADATLWTSIYNEEEWIEALIDFFKRVEPSIRAELPIKELEDDVVSVISLLINHLRTKEFLETAMKRMLKAHLQINVQNPLYHFEKMKKKPWAYVSGGTMETLIKTYAKRESPLTEEKRAAESPLDLLTFLIDLLKGLPPKVTDVFSEMLMYSPTHAFILQPKNAFFKKGWQDAGFTYTWIRDAFILPCQNFYAKILISPLEQKALLDAFSKDAFKVKGGHLSIKEFREEYASLPSIDSFLYRSLPLIPKQEYGKIAHAILEELMDKTLSLCIEEVEKNLSDIILADAFIDSLFACLLKAKKTVFFQTDLYEYIVSKARDKGFIAPSPLLFADTNWTRDYFAFVINPASEELELFRVDRLGLKGHPMSSWKHFFNPSPKSPEKPSQKPSWGVYTKPYEYGL